MDEPFGAVDPMTRDKLQAQFLRIQQHLKKSVLLVTHDLDEAIRLADRIAIMQSGKLLQYDTPEVILSRPANRFVHDFVGTDRALKRLSRIRIDHLVKPSPLVSINASAAEVISVCKGCRWVWVVDDGGRLVGWLDREAINEGALVKEAVIYGNPDDIAVTSGATLREALSRMLGQGFKNMPVVDENRRLVGEVTLSDIESATAEPEA
jgi:osmoprotectant transport system ATP-binding protein